MHFQHRIFGYWALSSAIPGLKFAFLARMVHDLWTFECRNHRAPGMKNTKRFGRGVSEEDNLESI